MGTRVRFGPPPRQDKVLGALPVVAEFCRRLDIAGVVDRAVPVRDLALLSHGEVIEALIANRLTSPAPLVHVEDWAAEWAVEEIFDLDAASLNDDRIGRALDAVAPALDGIVGSVGLKAIAEFGVDVARLHWDMTSISLFGDYDDPEKGFVEPRHGHPKDRRPDLKQIQTGLAVSGDGGIPVFHRAYHGGAGEVAQVVPALEALVAMAGERKFLLIGDSKLVSYTNLAAMMKAGVSFIAPASKSYVGADVLAGCDKAAATPVDYLAQRDQPKAADDRGAYRVSEDTMVLTGPRKSDPKLNLRRVFVWSSARAGAAVSAREKKLDRARGDLTRLTGGLGGRHYPDQAAVSERVAAIAAARRVKAYLTSAVGVDDTGKPTLTWSFDQTALDTEAKTDGWYALLTNLNPDEVDAAGVLNRYKGQEVVERRYGNFKGPLAVAPMFLKNNRRIEALISVICLALLIFCLVERAVRLAISPAVKLAGLWGGRPAKPTGQLIFGAVSRLRLIPTTTTSGPIVPEPPHLPAQILALLNVDATRTRYQTDQQ
jgi:transposase